MRTEDEILPLIAELENNLIRIKSDMVNAVTIEESCKLKVYEMEMQDILKTLKWVMKIEV